MLKTEIQMDGPTSFKFDNMWIKYKEFKAEVKKWWCYVIEELAKVLQEFHSNWRVRQAMYLTFITLIPKGVGQRQ